MHSLCIATHITIVGCSHLFCQHAEFYNPKCMSLKSTAVEVKVRWECSMSSLLYIAGTPSETPSGDRAGSGARNRRLPGTAGPSSSWAVISTARSVPRARWPRKADGLRKGRKVPFGGGCTRANTMFSCGYFGGSRPLSLFRLYLCRHLLWVYVMCIGCSQISPQRYQD